MYQKTQDIEEYYIRQILIIDKNFTVSLSQ